MSRPPLCVRASKSRSNAHGLRIFCSISALRFIVFLLLSRSVDCSFTEEEEHKVYVELNRLLEDVPDDLKLAGSRSFCVNRCLFDGVTKTYEQPASPPKLPEHIPDEKGDLYRKLEHTIGECLKSCKATAAYKKFLLRIITFILNPDLLPEMLSKENITSSKETTTNQYGH